MKFIYITSFFSIVLIAGLWGCAATAPEKKAEPTEKAPAIVNDFPTRDRVEYVLNCVAQHGGLTYITQYACGCKIDKIAEKMTFEEYEAAKTYGYLSKTAGEAGGAFRDPQKSKELRKKMKEAEAYAERMCFVK